MNEETLLKNKEKCWQANASFGTLILFVRTITVCIYWSPYVRRLIQFWLVLQAVRFCVAVFDYVKVLKVDLFKHYWPKYQRYMPQIIAFANLAEQSTQLKYFRGLLFYEWSDDVKDWSLKVFKWYEIALHTFLIIMKWPLEQW